MSSYIARLLESVLPVERIRSRLIDIVAYASDAGFYALEPKAVVQPVSEKEIIELFKFSKLHRVPLVFRTAGTSLSGQSVTDGILVDIARFWKKISVGENGNRVRVQPGITGSSVNQQLKPHKRKIGPDPSSIDSAMMGGILSNNSSGMCCGVQWNAYHTLDTIRFILPDGNLYDTGEKEDYLRFEKESQKIYAKLAALRDQILKNKILFEKIRAKYQMKNTVGYALNAFVDFFHPLDILAHLLIGAEGTLAFISEAVLKTIPSNPFRATALFIFHDIYDACEAIQPFADSGADAVELMDRASLRSIEHIKDIPVPLYNLPSKAAALLVEYTSDSPEGLQEKLSLYHVFSYSLKLTIPSDFTSDLKEQALLWKLRKGLFPSVGALRARGTTVVLEDIAVPVPLLGKAIEDLQGLFQESAYHDAIIFGHAKDGNIHFVITQSFDSSYDLERYDHFLQKVVKLVVEKYNGALKAEHGTGRNMAPFVEMEWGADAYQIMMELKKIMDPHNLLNPGVIINGDKKAHLRNLKSLPMIEEEVDKCIECGYCEFKCPSRDITLTPRQRIVVRRAMKRSEQNGSRYKKLKQEFQYDGMDTCAVDGLCATTCPVDIDTGALIKRLRLESHSHFQETVALFIARHFGYTLRLVKFLLRTGESLNGVLGSRFMGRTTGMFRKLIKSLPLWDNQIVVSRRLKLRTEYHKEQTTSIVYYPTCISRLIGGSADRNKKNIIDTFLSIAAKSGIRVIIPSSIGETCCSQIFSSKGFLRAREFMANKTVEALWVSTEEGKYPVVTDISSCGFTMKQSYSWLTAENKKRLKQMRVLDSIEFLEEYVIPNVKVTKTKKTIMLHPVCSLHKMGLSQQFTGVASRFAEQVELPNNSGCCGMAGDRGFYFPEFIASATKHEAEEVMQIQYDGYYSTAKTCEMALSNAVGKNYESILYLADESIREVVHT